jgi:hypothetical protein
MSAEIVGLSFADRRPGRRLLRAAQPSLCRRGGSSSMPLSMLRSLTPWFVGCDARQAGHNVKYAPARARATTASPICRYSAHDTELESYIIESHKPHDLDALRAGISSLTDDRRRRRDRPAARRRRLRRSGGSHRARIRGGNAESALRVIACSRARRCSDAELASRLRLRSSAPVRDVLFRMGAHRRADRRGTARRAGPATRRTRSCARAEAHRLAAGRSPGLAQAARAKSCSSG